MNREPNKEIEILLRKLSGKENGNIAAAEGNFSASDHEHLDADELNAYAENALPDSLRSRYTEHLADCGSCRRVVTQLSLSSTAATAQAAIEEPTPSRLKTFLAGLFSPLIIRYAVPAMAVVLVVALAWIVVRREPVSEQVAQSTESGTIEPAQPNPGAAAPVPSESGLIRKAESAPAPAQKEATSQATPSEDRAAATSTGNKAPEESKSGEVAAKQDEPQPAASVTVLAPATGGAAPTAQPKTVSDVDRNEPAKKKAEAEIANVQNQNQNQNQIQNQQERRIYDQRSGPSEPKAVQRGQRSNEAVGGVSRQRAKIAEEQDKDAARDDQAEVRNVGGHRFTKRGNIWVDALYNSNSATTNVSRGSEQYRSLMGDEPDLRAIVEQLKGEMIVVWKGRAYRIK